MYTVRALEIYEADERTSYACVRGTKENLFKHKIIQKLFSMFTTPIGCAIID